MPGHLPMFQRSIREPVRQSDMTGGVAAAVCNPKSKIQNLKSLAACVALSAAALLSAAPAAGQSGWWDAKWSCRREIAFPEKTDAQVFEVVFPAFTPRSSEGPGLVQPDGSDVRVVAGGEEVPARVFWIDPSTPLGASDGGLVHLVFERKGDAPHFIYWGGTAGKGDMGTVPFSGRIRAGCLLETRQYPGQEIRSLAEMRKAWAESSTQGLRFVPNVFFGHNPLGPNENFLSRFVGFFRADRDGGYLFATDSDDASFLLVDGKLVAEWPGAHGAAGQAIRTGTIDLKAGVHQVEYLHSQGGGGLLMDAAWRPPGAGQVVPIPPEAFVPVAMASVRGVEARSGALVPDFLPVNAGEAVLTPDASEYIVKMHFENLSGDVGAQHAVPPQEYSCRWLFGDGTTSAETSPDHVYLTEGDFDVTLVLVKGYDEKKTTMRVKASRDWGRETGAIDLREQYYDIVKAYDIGRMEPHQAYRAMYYFERIMKRDDVVRAGQTLLARVNGLPEQTVFDAVSLLAETMRVQGADFAGARRMLLAYEARMKEPEHAAALALAAGDIDMWHLKDLEAAEANYRRVIFTYAEKADKMTLRKALVRLGDIYRWRHDGAKAREFLHKAQSIPVDDRTPVQKSVRAGFLARSIEEFLATGDMEFAYEYLVTWAWEFPEDQLDGYWTELRVKWLIRNKEFAGGIAEVESLLQLNPKSLYAPGLLWLAADCAEATGDPSTPPGAGKPKAIALLERVLTDFPEATNKEAVLKRLEALRK